MEVRKVLKIGTYPVIVIWHCELNGKTYECRINRGIWDLDFANFEKHKNVEILKLECCYAINVHQINNGLGQL